MKKLPKSVKNAMKHPDKLGEGAKKRKALGKKNTKKAVLEEFKRGTLFSGSGKKVKNPKQAVAIAYSEAKKKKRK